MKKLTITPLSSARMAAAILVCLLMFASSADAGVAEVKKTHGIVDVFHAGARQAQALVVGNSVEVGDTIRTGRRSRTQLKFTDGSVLNIGSLTKIQVGEFSYNAETKVRKSNIRALRGTLRAVVSKAEDNNSYFRIETPGAVAAVRGTEWTVQVVSPTKSNFYGHSGSVKITNKNDPSKVRFLTVNQFIQVTGNKPPTAPRDMTIGEIKSMKLSTQQDGKAADQETSLNGDKKTGGAGGAGAASAPAADPAAPPGGAGKGGALAGGTGLNTGKQQTGVASKIAALKPITPPLTKSTPAAVNTNVNIVIQF